LLPSDYGLLAIAMVLIGFAGIFREFGFSSALVQNQNITEKHKSSIFWLNKNIEPIYAELRPGDIKHSFADIDLIKEKLKFQPVISFIDGLGKLAKY
jgi:hypothetical protein